MNEAKVFALSLYKCVPDLRFGSRHKARYSGREIEGVGVLWVRLLYMLLCWPLEWAHG